MRQIAHFLLLTLFLAAMASLTSCKKGDVAPGPTLPADPEAYLPVIQSLPTGKVTHQLEAPDNTFVTGNDSGAIRVENPEGILLRSLPGHADPITFLGFGMTTSTAPTLVSCDSKSEVVVTDFHSGKELERFKLNFLSNQIALSPDGSHLAATEAQGKRLTLFPIKTKQRFSRFQNGTKVRWTPDGKYVLIGGNNISFLEAKSWKPRNTLTIGKKPLLDFTTSMDGQTLFTLDASKRFAAYSIETGKKQFEAVLKKEAVGGITPLKGGGIVAVCDGPSEILLLSARNGQELTRYRCPYPIHPQTLVRHAGHFIAYGEEGGVPRRWTSADAATATASNVTTSTTTAAATGASNTAPSYPTCISPGPDGRLAIGMGNGQLAIWNPTGEPSFFPGHSNQVNAIAWHPDGFMIASGGKDGRIRLCDALSGKTLRTFTEDKTPVNALAFHPDGSILASDFTGNRPQFHGIRIWNAITGNEKQKMLGHRSPVNSVAFSPDGKVLISVGTAARGAILWDVTRRFSMRQLPVSAHSLAISPDSSQVAFACPGGRVKLMPIPRATLSLDAKGSSTLDLESIAYLSDAKQVATTGKDGILRAWETETRAEAWSLSHPRQAKFKSVAKLSGAGALATLSDDHGIDFISETGELLLSLHLRGPKDYLFQLPDGTLAPYPSTKTTELVSFVHKDSGLIYPEPSKRLDDCVDPEKVNRVRQSLGL